MMLQRRQILSLTCLATAGLAFSALPLRAATVVGTAYTMTNAAEGNAVMVYNRMDDGTLTSTGTVATGGNGTGAPLGSQGALAIGQGGQALLVVNAGSNSVSTFRISPSGALTLSGTFPSGGTTPNSIAIHGRLVYVLNSGVPNNVTGFYLDHGPALVRIPDSVRALSQTSTTPPQVGISADASFVVVTEKATNLIDIFPLGPNGYPGTLITHPSSGMTPFGFAFGRNNELIVSEAFGGAPNASAVSSYILSMDGGLTTVTASAPTHQSAACWVALNPGARVAYTANTSSATVSGFSIAPGGALSLLNSDGVAGSTPAGSEPVDSAVAPDAPYLYVLTNASPGISIFAIGQTGQLTNMGLVSAPAAASGLVLR